MFIFLAYEKNDKDLKGIRQCTIGSSDESEFVFSH